MCGTIAAVSVFAPNGASSLEDEVRSGRKIAVCWPGLLSPVTAPLTLSLRTVIGGVMFGVGMTLGSGDDSVPPTTG